MRSISSSMIHSVRMARFSTEVKAMSALELLAQQLTPGLRRLELAAAPTGRRRSSR